MTQVQKTRQLKDFEILGVGAVRRARWEPLAGQASLHLHPQLVPPSQQEIYQAILNQTLAWLRPQVVHEEKIPGNRDDFLFQLLREELKKTFPQTFAALQSPAADRILRLYMGEFPWQGPLLTEHFRYFPSFLKGHTPDPLVPLVAQKEWLWSYLSFADFGAMRTEKGQLSVPASLQFLYSPMAAPDLGLSQGLSAFYYEASAVAVRETKLEVWDAAVVDLLQEDRKFTQDQLLGQVQLLEMVPPLRPEQWRKKIQSLLSTGIIIEAG